MHSDRLLSPPILKAGIVRKCLVHPLISDFLAATSTSRHSFPALQAHLFCTLLLQGAGVAFQTQHYAAIMTDQKHLDFLRSRLKRIFPLML